MQNSLRGRSSLKNVKGRVARIKKLWMKIVGASVLWLVIPVFIIVLVPTWWYTRPILNLSLDDIEIYRLSTTILGITAAVGTLLNSARSAKSSSESVRISAESIRVTKEKEAREQSSHLIPLSSIGYFPLIAPFYKKKFDYMFNRFNKTTRNKLVKDTESLLIEKFDNERKNYMDIFRDNSYNLSDDNFAIKLVNMGKGSCVNLEYSFKFTNINEFKEFKIAPDYNLLSSPKYGYAKPISYSIEINSELELKFKDLYLEKFLDEEYLEWRSEGNGSEFNYTMNEQHLTEFVNIVKPSQEIEIYLPDEFLMLCKHYMNIKYMHYVKKNGRFNTEKYTGYLDEWLKIKNIKPSGELKISFFEESLIRTGEIDSNKKTELTYRVSLKDIEIKFKNDEVRYCLEINLSNPEKTF